MSAKSVQLVQEIKIHKKEFIEIKKINNSSNAPLGTYFTVF